MSFITPPEKLAEWVKSHPEKKSCTRCRVMKPVSEFGKRKNPRYSLEVYISYCKPCARVLGKEKKYNAKYLLKYPWVRNYTFAQSRCYKLGREITLTIADFKTLWFRDKAYNLKVPSIDRIDNSKGYIKGNCRFIERSLNSSLGSKLSTNTPKMRRDSSIRLKKRWKEWRKNKQNKHAKTN